MRVDKIQTSDRPVVEGWLFPFILEHIGWWSSHYRLNWNRVEMEQHIRANNLVERSCDDLFKADQNETELVRVLRDDEKPVGIVHAAIKASEFTRLKSGRLNWIWIDEDQRGKDLGSKLIKVAHDWLRDKDVAGVDLFVNRANESALSFYRKNRYQISDYQMILSHQHL